MSISPAARPGPTLGRAGFGTGMIALLSGLLNGGLVFLAVAFVAAVQDGGEFLRADILLVLGLASAAAIALPYQHRRWRRTDRREVERPPENVETQTRSKDMASTQPGSVDRPTERPGSRMLRQAGFGVALIALLSGAVNLLILVSPIYMFQVFDRVLLTFRVETLIYLSLVAGVCIVALGIFDALRGVAVARLGRWWDDTARPDLLDASLAAARIRGPNVGAALQDLHQVRNFVGGPSLLPFFDAPWTPLFIVVIFLLHPVLAIHCARLCRRSAGLCGCQRHGFTPGARWHVGQRDRQRHLCCNRAAQRRRGPCYGHAAGRHRPTSRCCAR